MTDDVAPRWAYRRASYIGIGLANLAVGVGIGVASISGGDQPALLVFALALASLCVWFGVRMMQAAVVVDGDRVTIRNITATIILRRSEIVSVELGRKDPWMCVGIAVLRDGRRIAMTAVQPPPTPGRRAKYDMVVNDLRRRLISPSAPTAR